MPTIWSDEKKSVSGATIGSKLFLASNTNIVETRFATVQDIPPTTITGVMVSMAAIVMDDSLPGAENTDESDRLVEQMIVPSQVPTMSGNEVIPEEAGHEYDRAMLVYKAENVVRVADTDTAAATISIPITQKKVPPDIQPHDDPSQGRRHSNSHQIACLDKSSSWLDKGQCVTGDMVMLEVTVEVRINTVEMRCEEIQHEADNTMESEQLREKMFVSRQASSCMDDAATTKISLGKSSYGVEYDVANNVDYIKTDQVTARKFMRELSRKARLETPLSPSTGQCPVGPPPPRPDTLPPPPASPPIPTTPTVSPPLPTRSLVRNDTAEIKEFDDGNVDDVRGPVGGEEEDVDTGVCGIRMQEQLRTRRSVTLPKEAFDKSAKKFVEKPAAPPPKVKIAIRMNIVAYGKYDPMLEGRLTHTFLEKMTRDEFIQPYVSVSTADSGVQANIIGVKHGNNILFVADRFSSWQRLYPAPPGKVDGKLSTQPPPATSMRPPPPHAATSPTNGYSGFGFEDIEELDSVVDDVRVQVDDREAVLDQVDDGRIGRHLVDDREAALVQDDGAVRDKVGGDGDDEGTGVVVGALTIRQPATKFFPPPPATMLTSTTTTRSPARREDLRLGFADIEELCEYGAADDVHEQVNDREPAQDEVEGGEVVRHPDDDGGAVQELVGGDGDVQEPGGDEEVPKEMSRKLRRPNVIYSTEEYDLSSMKTRSRRQLRRMG
jgi:hypothetical protein